MEMLSREPPDGTPVKEAAWLALRDSLCIIHLFNSVHWRRRVRAVIVICLGGRILPGDGQRSSQKVFSGGVVGRRLTLGS